MTPPGIRDLVLAELSRIVTPRTQVIKVGVLAHTSGRFPNVSILHAGSRSRQPMPLRREVNDSVTPLVRKRKYNNMTRRQTERRDVESTKGDLL